MTTDQRPQVEFVSSEEYRGMTLYLYRRPEQDVTFEREIYGQLKDQTFGKIGTEDCTIHHTEAFFVSYKLLEGDRHWLGWHSGATPDKALKSAKGNVDVALANEALWPRLVEVVGSLSRNGELPEMAQATAETPVNTVVWIYSRGGWRRGVVEKVGRTNLTVAFTTRGAIESQGKTVTRKSDKFQRIFLDPTFRTS